jgi:hypothetical protein
MEVVAVSLSEVTGEELSGVDFGVTGAPVFGVSEVMRSADGVPWRIVRPV